MDTLLTFILPAAIFLALEFFWCRPAWLRPPADVPRDRGRQPGPAQLAPDWDPSTWTFVQHRLDVLADELERLNDDPEIFALAFRTHVVQAAYKALLVDAARLANASRLAAVSPLSDVTTVELEIEISNSFAPLREELEV
jgi:hypothetical protein